MKIHFTHSSTPEAHKIHTDMSRIYGQAELKDADVVVALGGDGHMLGVLRQLNECKALTTPIYGMNLGTVGYAMNSYKKTKLIERIESAESQYIRPLRLNIKYSSPSNVNIITEQFGWNDGTVFRQDMQTLRIRVRIGGQVRIKDISCDGLIYATPFGSTAYNRSAGGPILPLTSHAFALTPICPHRPRDWPGAVLPRDAVIHIENLDTKKRPMMATYDSSKIEHVKSVEMSMATRKKAYILFDQGHGLEDRILDAQFPF